MPPGTSLDGHWEAPLAPWERRWVDRPKALVAPSSSPVPPSTGRAPCLRLSQAAQPGMMSDRRSGCCDFVADGGPDTRRRCAAGCISKQDKPPAALLLRTCRNDAAACRRSGCRHDGRMGNDRLGVGLDEFLDGPWHCGGSANSDAAGSRFGIDESPNRRRRCSGDGAATLRVWRDRPGRVSTALRRTREIAKTRAILGGETTTGTCKDLEDALEFAARGCVRSSIETQPLEAINDVFARLKRGDV